MSRDSRHRADEPPMRRIHGRILAGILLAGAVLRLLYLLELRADPQFAYHLRDSAYHHHWAVGLSQGRWDVLLGNADPEIRVSPFFRPPGHPYFLAIVYGLFGSGPLAFRIVQMALGLGNALLAFALGRRWFGPRVGLLFAGAMAVGWIFLYSEAQPLEPTLLLALTLGLLYTLGLLAEPAPEGPFGRGGLALLAGVLLGLAALVRPNVLPFGLFAAAWILWLGRRRRAWRPSWRAVAAFAAGAAVAIAPATIRNYWVAREFVPICCNGGINLYLGNNPAANGIDPAGPGMWSWNSFDYPAIVRQLGQRLGRPMKHGEASRYFARAALRYVRDNPGRTARLTGRKIALFWGPCEIGNEREVGVERQHSVLLKNLPFSFPLVLGLALAGLALGAAEFLRRRRDGTLTERNRRQAERAALALGFVILYAATYAPFFAASRFRVPVIPPLLLFGALAFHGAWRLAEAGRRAAAMLWLALAGVLALAASVNVGGVRDRPERWHVDRGVALLLADRREEAIEEFNRALAIMPNELMAHLNLGVCYRQSGQWEKALGHFREAARVAPDFEKAHAGAAQAALRLGRREDALASFREVVRINPSNAGAHAHLGVMQAAVGRLDEAVRHFQEAVRADPQYVQARVGLGYALLEQGKREEAAAQFGEALQINPADAMARAGLKTSRDGKSGE